LEGKGAITGQYSRKHFHPLKDIHQAMGEAVQANGTILIPGKRVPLRLLLHVSTPFLGLGINWIQI